MRPAVTSFASTTLTGGGGGLGTPLAYNDASFTVAVGTGSLFPVLQSWPTPPGAGVTPTLASVPFNPTSTGFVVAIDSELLLCSARSGDSITVAQRGYGGTAAAAHAVGASVVLSATSVSFDRIWGALPDAANADVPPFARGGWNGTSWDYQGQGSGPGPWDDEFEPPWGGQGSPWTVSPLPANLSGGSAPSRVDFGTDYRSHLHFARASGDLVYYTVYRPFLLPNRGTYDGVAFDGGFQAICKLSAGAYLPTGDPWLTTQFFVAACSNPSSYTSGNQCYMNLTLMPGQQLGASAGVFTRLPQWAIYPTHIDSGAQHDLSNATVFTESPTPVYLAVLSNGANYYRFAYSRDGLTWQILAGFNKQIDLSTQGWIGLRFALSQSGGSGQSFSHNVLCDWIRVIPGGYNGPIPMLG